MTADDKSLRAAIDNAHIIVSSIKNSLDRTRVDPRRYFPSSDYADASNIKDLLLRLEAIRIDLRMSRNDDANSLTLTLSNARDNLQEITEDETFRLIAGKIKFRISIPIREKSNLEWITESTSIMDATLSAIFYIENIINNLSKIYNPENQLRTIVPEQKLGPAQFDIVNNRITISKQTHIIDTIDFSNANIARDTLQKSGEKIIEALEQSNCDPRVLQTMRELQNCINDNKNIIELGLVNITLERVCKGSASELPDAILGQIEGHTAGVGMYVAQFPAWRRFSDNAASIELDTQDISSIAASAQTIADRLAGQPDISDPEVPKLLKSLNALIENPKGASKRAAFAALRTIENLVSKIYQYSADFIDQTTRKSIDGLSTTASKLIVTAFLSIALAGVANLGGVSTKISEAVWMKTATEIVKKQMESLTK